MLPLTFQPEQGFSRGVVLLVRRSETRFAARMLSGVSIFECVGGRDPEANAALGQALQQRGHQLNAIRSLRLDSHDPGENCWAHVGGVCVSLEDDRNLSG